jgi:hypothetical protein
MVAYAETQKLEGWPKGSELLTFSKVSNIDQRWDREGFHAGSITVPLGIYR